MLTDHPDYPDFVKVLDFGIAKLLGAAQTPAGHHTEVGTLLGTPAFMSPEQCLGDLQLDHRSDIYSLGVILFLMLAGRLPFEDEAIGRLILAHVHQPAPPLSLIAPQTPPPSPPRRPHPLQEPPPTAPPPCAPSAPPSTAAAGPQTRPHEARDDQDRQRFSFPIRIIVGDASASQERRSRTR